ncbi:MAG: ABC transporter permease [Firmicutes bacterium]|nr:ABC transporter permease [Bacillota bacterium]
MARAKLRAPVGGTLTRKLLRQISRTRGQFLSLVAVVAIGIMVFVLMKACHRELYGSLYRYYERYRFNDLAVQVRRAPSSIVDVVKRVDGVAAAEGRLMFDARVEIGTRAAGAPAGIRGRIAGGGEGVGRVTKDSITGRIVGIPDAQTVTVNDIEVLSGRRPRPGTGEILVDPKFAAAHSLSPGDELTLYVHGRAAGTTVCGTASGPEFIYAAKDPAALIQDPLTFGIMFMSRHDMASLFGYEGEVNQVVIRYAPGTDTARTRVTVDKILDPYGRIASLERRDQFSHAAISAEFEQLKTMSTTLPTIFLLVAAAIMYISISRTVREQRVQIGVMKAMGYSGAQVLAHYTWFALAGGLTGALVGAALGVSAVPAMLGLYSQYFNLPLGTGGVALEEVSGAVLMSAAVSAGAGLLAARGVLRLVPAQAMRPAPPPSAARTWLEAVTPLWVRLSFSWKMAMRNLARHKGRALLTVMGATFAVVLIMLAAFMFDAVDYAFRRGFIERQRYDISVVTVRPVGGDALAFLKGIPGVTGVEPYCQYAAKMCANGMEQDISLKGMIPGSRMQVLVAPDGLRTDVPDDGVLISEGTARKLGLSTGSRVRIEMMDGAQREREVTVRGVVQELVGGNAYASMRQVNELAGESASANGAWITATDPSRVRKVLEGSPVAASISSPADFAAEFEEMTEMLMFSVGLMTSFGLAMGFSIMYTVSSINIEERKRELAFIKALGLPSSQAASIVFNENAVLSLLGIVIGLPLGKVTADAYMTAAAGDFWTFPVVIYPRTYLFAAAGGYLFLVLAQRSGRRRISRLDPTEELKTQE